MRKDEPEDGHKSSHAGTSDKNTPQLNKMILNSKGMPVLDAGAQQLQNIPQNVQGFNVFIFSPSKLNDVGLVTKVKNGEPVVVNDSKDGSSGVNTPEALAPGQLIPLLETQNISPEAVDPDRLNKTNLEGHREVTVISVKSQSRKGSAVVKENKESLQCLKMYGGVRRKRSGEDAGILQKGSNKHLKCDDAIENWSSENGAGKDKASVSGDGTSTSVKLWHCERRRHLSQFADHWQLALAEIGYINCPMMECNYISLSDTDIAKHYLQCDGKSSVAVNTCPVCMHRLGTEKDLKAHVQKSHPGDGFYRKTLQRVMAKNELKAEPEAKLLPRRRGFCKVHKVSWDMAIESKGYVKCFFQNCSYLALTVDEMIKHYGICSGGGDVGVYPCPYKCPHCGGCVETVEKLNTHVGKSHASEQHSFQIQLSASGSGSCKKDSIIPPLGLVKPIKSDIQVEKDTSLCQDSFIITLNASNQNEAAEKQIEAFCLDKVKVEINGTDEYKYDSVQDVCLMNRDESVYHSTSFPVVQVKHEIDRTLPEKQSPSSEDEIVHYEREEHNVAKILGAREKYCEGKADANEIVIERVEKSTDSESVVLAEIPDVSIQLLAPIPGTIKGELGVVRSEKASDVSICTVEEPPDCVSTEMNWKQHSLSENQLFSSDLSGSGQSNNIDVEDDALSHSHMKQYSNIYSDDSYSSKLYQQVNNETSCDGGPICDTITKQFDICQNVEQSPKDYSGDAKCKILKTYNRRMLRLHSNATICDVSNPVQLRKSAKEMTCLKKEKSDATTRQQNESAVQLRKYANKVACSNKKKLDATARQQNESPVQLKKSKKNVASLKNKKSDATTSGQQDQQVELSGDQGTQGTLHCHDIPCSANNVQSSHMKDAGSTNICDIQVQSKVDIDVAEEVEDSKIGKSDMSVRGHDSVAEANSEPSASSECQNSMEIDICIVKDTQGLQCGQSVESGRRRGRPRGRGCRGRGSRGRGCRGRGSRGRGRNNFAHKVLQSERELDQSSDEDKLVKVSCAKCKEEMQKKLFEQHNRMKHCGLAWIEGGDPIDFNDEKLLMGILKKILLTRKWLTCETCGDSKRSVVGFISHLQCCQKSVQERLMLRVECTICKRIMLPVSLKVHMSTVHKNPKAEVMTLEEMEVQCKMKRAAATKAVSLMQEFIGEEEVVEGTEKPTKHSDGLYLKVDSHNVTNFTRGSWKRSITMFGKVSCRHVGCSVESITFEEMLEHDLNCPMAPKKGYACRACSFHCETEPEMMNHVTSAHGSSPECSDSSDLDSSGEDELGLEDDKKSRRKKSRSSSSAAQKYKMHGKMKIANKMKFLSTELSGPVFGDKPYVPAVKWTLSFQLENYMQSLYPNIHSTRDDWVALTSAEAMQYLPHTKESVQISHLSMKHKVLVQPQKAVKQWHRLALFEAEVIDGTPIFFAGGPVWATAWCPIPLHKAIYRTAHINQYLAVSCHNGMEDTYISGQRYSHNGLIQIWDFGHLDNQQPCTTPKLALGIAHNCGAVWCMEWCPSGCYDTPDMKVPNHRLRRLGLLGAACSDGSVRIFSVCFPSEVQDKISDSPPIFKVEPVRTLVLDDRQTCLLADSEWQCTRLSWYKGKGHRIIAGSFTNGMVAVWDMSTESPLLIKRTGKSCTMYPYHSFQAHIGVVSAIALIPQDDGRYLMTGSFDRSTKYWDLEDTSAPITVKKRGSVTDGVWLTHWVSAVNSFDDSYSLGHANGTLNPVRNFGFTSYPLLAQNSVAWGLSTCDWVNAVAQSTLAGELTVIFSHQLLIAVDTEKGMKDKRMIISYTEVAHLVNEEEEGSHSGKFSDKTNSINSSSSAVEKSQSDFEGMFLKVGGTKDTALSTEGSHIEDTDTSCIDNCDVAMPGCGISRKNRGNQNYEKTIERTGGCVQDGAARGSQSLGDSPNKSLNTSLQSDIQLKDSTMTGNLCTVVHEDNILSDKLRNVNISCRTSNLLQDDFGVSDSVDAERCFSRESSVVREGMSKADEADDITKDDMDYPEKTDDEDVTFDNDTEYNSDSDSDILDESKDKKEAYDSFKIMSYDMADKNYGLILCDFPTDNLKHMPREARLWMRQSDKMRAVDASVYPISSINRVSWNPNCRSFLWLAAGYHCGLVRVPCMRAMHCRPIEEILQHGEHKIAELQSKDFEVAL
ncbi:uncharacterized protein LOC110829207 isoform X4 [Zootermopsis nevadensis]|uniref:uncharacterized protein LOC110829207 isoform X4 n=1 Tax=Zootermopsis nevadensis TaxID=136037 RepID=UPI000B8E554E|nr:uncharacterized protein LOC110829207 isoform X4 [Zootermopsis nevadensis]